MEFPPEFLINNTLLVGTVYEFTAPELITTDVPHRFIIVAIEDDDNFMLVCTSQIDNKKEYFERAGLDTNGLVIIEPDEDKVFVKTSCVNCNDPYKITKQKLINKTKSKSLEYKGVISLDYYSQIRVGIINSHTNDLPENMLKHPDD